MLFHLRNPRTVLRKALTGLILFFLGAVSAYLVSLILPQFVAGTWGTHPLMPVFVMTLISLVAYKPIERFVKWFLEKYLFRRKSYAQMTLMDLAEDLRTNLDLQELANMVVNTFGEVLRLRNVALLVPDATRSGFEIASSFGWPIAVSKRILLACDAPLVQHIKESGPHVVVRSPLLKSLSWQEANEMGGDFDVLRSGWVVPLFVREDLVGMIAFGAHSPDMVFDESDFHFFREFAEAVAPCVRNAQVVRQLRNTNFQLQDSQAEWFQKTKMSAIEKLAAGIAHEVHNPLAIISGKAQVLLMQKNRAPLEPHIEEALNVMVKQTRRAADITRKLLMYSQESKSPREWFSLGKILDETVSLVGYQASLDRIEISCSVDPELPEFFGNVQEIREIFLNLFFNAVEAIESEGRIGVELRQAPEAGIIEIRFSDSGRGIAPENLEKIFNPFFTTRHAAVGLGLFVARQIVSRYGGAIRVESQAGEGSLFIIQLPCRQEETAGSAKIAPLGKVLIENES
ncbi:MAG TPA: ATP-binding protein [Candidatus Omnitrophota bacterium]|nr:ATP-binding protein [Candidatus Omnitrophota bacterium]HQB93753.1 ATP-binding protein [Candidatus Omnitrophota bacterium]